MPWDILYLPAIKEDGTSLWPEAFPLERLEAIRRESGTAIFECMYMGRPEALSGDIFKPEWFGLCQLGTDDQKRSCVLFYEAGEIKRVPLEEMNLYQFWDLAISSKETADYTACVTLALHPDTMNLFVLDITRGHWSFEKTQQEIARLGAEWHPMGIGIESVAYQAAAVQEAIRTTMLPIVEVKADRDKVTRARLPAARAEAGKVFVLRMPWCGSFLDELQSFPTGKHDDMVDAFSGATALAALYVPSRLMIWGERP